MQNVFKVSGLAMLMAGVSFANTLTVSSLDTTRGQFSVWLKADDIEKEEYYAGAIDVTIDHTYHRTAFCIDLFTNIGFSDYDSDLNFPGGDSTLRRVGWLIANELPSITSGEMGAALQVAIWDIIHDNGDGLNAGRIQSASATSTGIVTAANTFLSSSYGRSSQYAVIYENSQNGVPAQRLVSDSTIDGGPMPTPEGSSWALMLGGLSCLTGRAYLARRRR